MRLYPVERHKSPDYEKVHKACETLMLRLPSVMGDQILQALTDVFAMLPKDILNLIDYGHQLEAPHGVRILDIEVCRCWFQGMTRASSAKKRRAPDSWHAFRRTVWDLSARLVAARTLSSGQASSLKSRDRSRSCSEGSAREEDFLKFFHHSVQGKLAADRPWSPRHALPRCAASARKFS